MRGSKLWVGVGLRGSHPRPVQRSRPVRFLLRCPQVVAADVSIGNGRAVVHVIDRVLLPADLTLPTPYVTVAGAAQAANLSTLLAAVTASDASFLTTLTDPDFNGTVLAPTVSRLGCSQRR